MTLSSPFIDGEHLKDPSVSLSEFRKTLVCGREGGTGGEGSGVGVGFGLS